MLNRFRSVAGVGLLGLVSLGLASCGETGDRKPVYPVSGQVLVTGRPADGAMVVFHPAGADDKTALRPVATCGPDGKFQMTTYLANDGVPEGEYVVTIVWPGQLANNSPDLEQGPDKLNGRFLDPITSKIRVQVERKKLVLEPFKLD